MKLDDSTKMISILSGVVAVFISISTFISGAKLQAIQKSINSLSVQDKQMDVSKKSYDLSARLTADFSLPLARSFALQYASGTPVTGRHISMPTDALSREFAQVMGGWASRKGLMTGHACQTDGLMARQVVTVIVKNIGSTDAIDVVMTARQKTSPMNTPSAAWQERAPGGGTVGYDGLLSAQDGWTEISIPLGALHGSSSPPEDRMPLQVVLASVSGSTALFGTVIVPVSISWTDEVSKRRQSLPVLESHAAELRSDLLGAEIGSLSSACQPAPR